MAQTGVLDYQRYLNTLQTLNNLGQTFPTNQQTYNFSVVGSTTSSWTATVSWETLILDKVSYSSKASGYVPNVDASQVVGYFEGSTSTQYSTGVISIPANMYTGPILPGGDFNVPLTVVHLSWFDGTTRYAQQIGFIQNWEPGVEIGDPTLDFNFFPVYSIPSTLTLTGEAGIVYGDNLTLVATTDMSIDLGVNATRVRFYRVSTGTDVVLGNAYFTGTVATLVLPTNPSLPIGDYNIYAVSQPRGVYRSATSNTLNVRVEAGVPLIVTTSTFTPSQAYYYPGHTVNYRLGVIADPAFTATGVAIANPIDIKLVDGITPFTETNILSGNFVNGQTTTNFTVQSSMIDVARQYPQTTYTITTSTQNSTQYTATLFVSNTETVASSWGYQTAGRYRNGSTSTTINVATSTSVTVTGQAFPLTITQDSTSTYFDEAFNITVTTNTATYYANISLIANNGTTSTTLFSGNNSGASSFTVTNILITTTGTYTITASYPGDLGQSLINANLPSTSNTLTHIVRLGNDLLPTPIVALQRTPSNDIVRVSASTSTTLTNTVTFLYNVILLDTSSWVRSVLTTSSTYISTPAKSGGAIMIYGSNSASGSLERNFDSYRPSVPKTSGKTDRRFIGWSSNTGTYNLFALPFGRSYHRLWKWDAEVQGRSRNPTSTFPSFPWFGSPDVVIVVRNISPSWEPYRLWNAFDYASDGSSLRFSEFFNDYLGTSFLIQQNYISEDWPKNVRLHNSVRLFKYYNGSNYNLSAVTGTNISEILDPLTEGTTWNKDFIGTITTTTKDYLIPSVIYAPLNSAPAGAPAGSSGPSRLLQYIQDGPVQVELYDIYRVDTIGTADGYNVIALDSTFYGTDPTDMSEANPRRLYFRVTPYISKVTGIYYRTYNPSQNPFTYKSVKTRYIDLVEYIGEVEWEKPIENAEQQAGTQPRSKIKVKLFRFTPTIPQANTQFKTNAYNTGTTELTLPDPITTSTYVDGTTIPNNGFRVVKFSTSLNRSQNNIRPTQILPFVENRLMNPDGSYNFDFTVGYIEARNAYRPFPKTSAGLTYIPFAWIDNWQDPTTGAINNNAFKLNGQPISTNSPESITEANRYDNYGQKIWQSTNPGDPVADNLAEFYNEWATAFSGMERTGKASGNTTLLSFDPIYSTSTYITPLDGQVAKINLAAETIPVNNVSTNLHARWPGTLSLPLEYGRYNPFDIYAADPPPTLDYLVVGGGGAGGSGSLTNPFSSVEPKTFGIGGGGGAGGMITGTMTIAYGEQYYIVVGRGGNNYLPYPQPDQSQTVRPFYTVEYGIPYAWGAQNGTTSSFGSIVANGGGRGGAQDIELWAGANGASGGGSAVIIPGINSSTSQTGGLNVAGQGNIGGTSFASLSRDFPGGIARFIYKAAPGGGGGAGGPGQDGQIYANNTAQGGAGGLWKQWFDGNYYAGGGAAASGLWTQDNYPYFPSFAGTATAHYGTVPGGGGRGILQRITNSDAIGKDGVVIIRTLKTISSATTVGAIVTEVGDYRYYKWTSTTSTGSIIF